MADLSADVDGLVAGRLWIEIRNDNPPGAYGASSIMRNVRNALLAELGIEDAGERADKTWASTVVRDDVDDPTHAEESPEPRWVLRVVLQHLREVGVVTLAEAEILASASDHADWLDEPMRGPAGLTSPEALEVLTWLEPTKARAAPGSRQVGVLGGLVG